MVPQDQFYGGGVDMLYPGGMMNIPFTDADWNDLNVTSMPQPQMDFTQSYQQQRIPPAIEVSHLPPHMLNIPRPKSSPSTFPPNVEDLLFPENPFKVRHEEFPQFTFPVSPQPQVKVSNTYFSHDNYHHPNSMSARSSPARQMPIPIAPDPAGLRQIHAMKRMRDEEEFAEYNARKRKRAPSSSGPIELSEEEQLLIKLKEEENLPWKDIAVRFDTELNKKYQVPALQMRFKRLRERMRTWTDTDIQALEQAYEYWEKFQFDIIAAKMLDFGATERWPTKYCARKWEDLHPDQRFSTPNPNLLQDPWNSEHCSPVESMTHSPRQSLGL
ncbi:hypothetical protein MMC25_003045 [Agyrium rufum]|nr:hypothetical protein [Agyrium rufum]